jgi:hypothetical protein
MGSWTQGDFALHKFLIRLGLLDASHQLTGSPRDGHKLLSFLDGQELINEEQCVEALADALCMDWYRLKGAQLQKSIALLKDSLFKSVSVAFLRSMPGTSRWRCSCCCNGKSFGLRCSHFIGVPSGT